MDEPKNPSSPKKQPESKPAPKKKPAEPTKEKKGGSPALAIILLVLLLGSVGYNIYLMTSTIPALEAQSKSDQETITAKDSEIDRINLDLEAKIDDYKALMEEYEELGLDNTQLQETVAELENERDRWKKSASASKREKELLRKKLERVMAEAEIQRIELQEKLDHMKLVNDSLTTEVETLVSSSAMMSDTINTLEEKVAIASILKAEDVSVQFFSEKEKEVKPSKSGYKAKNLSRMTVTSKLADNKVAQKDDKTFIMRILGPEGSVLFDFESGGGSFETADGKTNFYTVKKDMKFDNTGQEVIFNYKKSEEYEPGTYKVEIFAEGYLIGTSDFIVK